VQQRQLTAIETHIEKDKETLRRQGWDIDGLILHLSDIKPEKSPSFAGKGEFLLCKALLNVPERDVLALWRYTLNFAGSDFASALSHIVYKRLKKSSQIYLSTSEKPSFSKIREYCLGYLNQDLITIKIPLARRGEQERLSTWLRTHYPDKEIRVQETITHFEIFVF
jgi:hypothetical protein